MPRLLALLTLALQQPPQQPGIIVKIIQPERNELSGLADVLIGAFGLSGALTLMSIVAGLIAGGVLYFVRHRRREP